MARNNVRKESISTPSVMEYNIQLNTDREKVKYTKRIETIVRSSLEYRDYINFLKDYVDMNRCAFFKGVENGNGSRVRIEVHHEPLTLFDIVQTVINKYIKQGIPLNDLFIADEVLSLHYLNNVGLVPLSKSVHQIVHHGTDIIIPLTVVYGDYKKFLKDYEDYIDENLCYKLEQKLRETKHINREKLEDVLTPTFVYIDVDGFELPQRIPSDPRPETYMAIAT